jgi:hypothetical protein
MRGGVFRLDVRSSRFWRPIVGLLAAYAVAAQSLLIAVGGFALPSHASDSAPALEFCLHDSQNAPDVPAGNPDHTGCTRCIFCFAGSHEALIEAAPVAHPRLYAEDISGRWEPDKGIPARLPAYSIAQPRGPPSSA